MSRDFGRSDVRVAPCMRIHVARQILVAACRSSCSATKFPCRWLPERNGLQSATNCDGIQNRHVVASVYDICNGICDRQTDTILESSYGNMSAHKKFQPKAQKYKLAVDRYMQPWMTGMHR